MSVYVPVLGSFLDVNEMIVIFCVIIVAYLSVMHVEFRQLRKISKKYTAEETELSRCIRDLKSEMAELSDLVRSREIKKISSHVSGASDTEKSAEKGVEKDAGTESAPGASKPVSGKDDSASLEAMLDKV